MGNNGSGLTKTNGANGNGKALTTPADVRRRSTREEMTAWLTSQLARGDVERLELVATTERGSAFVDDWTPIGGDVAALAEIIHATAQRDSEDGPDGSAAGAYSLLARRAKGEASRFNFRVSGVVRVGVGPIEPADLRGQAAQAMRHLNERHESSALFVVQLVEQLNVARQTDQATVEGMLQAYREMMRDGAATASQQLEQQSKLITKLMEGHSALLEKHLDSFALIEDLTSAKNERDLDVKKADRKLARGDKLFETFFPILVRAIGSKLLAGGAPAKPAVDAVATPAAAATPATTAATPATPAPTPGERDLELTQAQRVALGEFLQKMTPADIEGIYTAVCDGSRARFEAVVVAFQPKKEGP